MGLGDGGDRVIGDPGRVHDFHAVHVPLVGSGPGSSLDHDGHRRSSRPGTVVRTPAVKAGPEPGRSGETRSLGGIDHEHPNRVAHLPIAAEESGRRASMAQPPLRGFAAARVEHDDCVIAGHARE